MTRKDDLAPTVGNDNSLVTSSTLPIDSQVRKRSLTPSNAVSPCSHLLQLSSALERRIEWSAKDVLCSEVRVVVDNALAGYDADAWEAITREAFPMYTRWRWWHNPTVATLGVRDDDTFLGVDGGARRR